MWHDVPNRGGRITIGPLERATGDIGLSSGWQGDNSGADRAGAQQRLRHRAGGEESRTARRSPAGSWRASECGRAGFAADDRAHQSGAVSAGHARHHAGDAHHARVRDHRRRDRGDRRDRVQPTGPWPNAAPKIRSPGRPIRRRSASRTASIPSCSTRWCSPPRIRWCSASALRRSAIVASFFSNASAGRCRHAQSGRRRGRLDDHPREFAVRQFHARLPPSRLQPGRSRPAGL